MQRAGDRAGMQGWDAGRECRARVQGGNAVAAKVPRNQAPVAAVTLSVLINYATEQQLPTICCFQSPCEPPHLVVHGASLVGAAAAAISCNIPVLGQLACNASLVLMAAAELTGVGSWT